MPMPKSENQPANNNHGQVFFTWQFSEFVQYERSRTWYGVSGIVALLLIIWSLWEKNFLFALGIIMVGLIVALHANREPLTVKFAINEDANS